MTDKLDVKPGTLSLMILTTLDVLGCSKSRTMKGLKFVSDDCGQSMCSNRSPACQLRTSLPTSITSTANSCPGT